MSDAAWHPDPYGRFELRYWDGAHWTEHVATDGVQAVDPEPLTIEDGSTDESVDDGAAETVDGAMVDDEAAAGEWPTETTDAAPPVEPPTTGSPTDSADDGRDATDQPTDDTIVDGDPDAWDPPATRGGAGVDELPGAAVLGAPVATGASGGAGDTPAAAAVDLGAMPPPSPAAPPAGMTTGDLGPDGIGGGLLDDAVYAERATERVALQNPRMLKVRLGRDVMIKRGSMIAYQGQMTFNYESEGGGMGRLVKRALASDNAKMARVSGQGDLFLADDANEIHMLTLAGGGLVVNGPNLLAFEDGMTFKTRSLGNAGIVAGGVFVTDVQGHGWVAVTCHGTPVRLDTDAPTLVDAGSAVAWSSSLQVDLNVQKLSIRGMRSGEIAQLAFRGQGFVLVQASEGPNVPAHSHG